MDKQQAEKLLRKATRNPKAKFRPGQWEAIDALANNKEKLLVVQRTGWGKSIVYFLAASMIRRQGDGPALIISPLLALMRNQLEASKALGVRTVTINSSNRDKWGKVKNLVLAGKVDALLISPERLSNESFCADILDPIIEQIGLFAIDEAHCVSDWGHDFRPDYVRILDIIARLSDDVPLLATTATANEKVIEDVQRQFGDMEVIRGSLARKTLALDVLNMPSSEERLRWLADHLPLMPGSGIIYALTTREAEEVADWLQRRDIDAYAYHASVKHSDFSNSDSYKKHLEEQLLNNNLKALVATVALGMGFDKKDLGFVIHYQAPKSIMSYYQQVGRAGRSIPKAYGIMLLGQDDYKIHRHFWNLAFPEERDIQKVLKVLGKTGRMSEKSIANRTQLDRQEVAKILKLLSTENPPAITRESKQWELTSHKHVPLDRDRVRSLLRHREAEWTEIMDYASASECLMAFMQQALDDPTAVACGKCSVCLGYPVLEGADLLVDESGDDTDDCPELAIDLISEIPGKALEQYGWNGSIPDALRAREGRALADISDPIWGNLLTQGKTGGAFSAEIVDSIAVMIRERWQPEPEPKWITFVPSARNSKLVAALAEQLGKKTRFAGRRSYCQD